MNVIPMLKSRSLVNIFKEKNAIAIQKSVIVQDYVEQRKSFFFFYQIKKYEIIALVIIECVGAG